MVRTTSSSMFPAKLRLSLGDTAKHLVGQIQLLLLVLWVASCVSAQAAQVVYMEPAGELPATRQQVETAAKFYGLDENVILLNAQGDRTRVLAAIRNPGTVAVIIHADALAFLSPRPVLAALQRTPGHSLPLLLAGMSEASDPQLLSRWSEGTIRGCKKLANEPGAGSYVVARDTDITRQLGGSKLPRNAGSLSYLVLDPDRGRWLLAAQVGGRDLPVFAVSGIGTQSRFFFATGIHAPDFAATSDPYQKPAVFATLAPYLMFLRFAAGERAWHSSGHYANLTIDDPWLREPYGHVSYEGLLGEMERHNFHTTLAFIPWNFDRSQLAVVSLFRKHSNRYSISVHGNNHDHQEFGPYGTRPLDRQSNDIKQALARMAKFSELTQLPFDPVMVFPHSISPEQTLTLLKCYNFVATANSVNVPLGSKPPVDPEFVLRPVTLAFSNFPSLRRYSAEVDISEPQLAIDAFLDNPMLFYVHQSFFVSGMEAFNKTADLVNQIQPNTQWQSLGYIAHHLYLERLRDDGNYDIRAYAGTIRIFNRHEHDATFFVEKEENFALPLTVFVDGKPYRFQRSNTGLRLQLRLQSGQEREIAIRYQNDFNLAAIPIAKSSPRIYVIRLLSDFRDNVVSRTEFGRWFIRSYSENGGSWNRAAAVFMAAVMMAAAFWYTRRAKKRSRAPRPVAPSLPNCT